jgi:hypothetical protein
MTKFDSLEINFQEDIVSRKNENGSVILMKMDDSDIFFKISGIAAEVYMEIEKGNKLATIYKDLCTRFPNKEDQITEDIDSFIKKLDSLNLLSK